MLLYLCPAVLKRVVSVSWNLQYCYIPVLVLLYLCPVVLQRRIRLGGAAAGGGRRGWGGWRTGGGGGRGGGGGKSRSQIPCKASAKRCTLSSCASVEYCSCGLREYGGGGEGRWGVWRRGSSRHARTSKEAGAGGDRGVRPLVKLVYELICVS